MLAGGVYLIYGDTKTSTVARKQARIHLKHPIKRAKTEFKKLKKPATKRKIQFKQRSSVAAMNVS